MNKLILLSIVLGSYMFAGIHGEADNSLSQSNTNEEKYSFAADSSEDNFKAEARKRGGKGNRGRRRGGGGLR